jgi:hypothetical protein
MWTTLWALLQRLYDLMTSGDARIGDRVRPWNDRNKADRFKLAAAVIAQKLSRFILA